MTAIIEVCMDKTFFLPLDSSWNWAAEPVITGIIPPFGVNDQSFSCAPSPLFRTGNDPQPYRRLHKNLSLLSPDSVIGSGSSPPTLDAITKWEYRHTEVPWGHCNQSLGSFSCDFFPPTGSWCLAQECYFSGICFISLLCFHLNCCSVDPCPFLLDRF
ncbi:hypothetical protein TNCV_5078431 [Trichonephila clavipes]|nr:hypothetical protein TNCV_5078431 [Trichonephila clavipes]